MSGAARILALFPGALGDLLCCWPALAGLRQASGGRLVLAARDAWFDALPEGALTALSIERREVADLFGSAPLAATTRALFSGATRVESWTGHGDDNFIRRLKEASGSGAVAVHPFRALAPGEHAAQYYARCVGSAATACRLPVRAAAAQWAAALWQQHGLGGQTLVIHPGSGSARKNWEGMAEVSAAWRADGGQVVALGGPTEAGRAMQLPYDVAVRGAPLDRVAAVLARAPRYLGNDSGISHLAALVGGRGVAVFGPTDPVAWRPPGDGISVLYAPQGCSRCGADRFCVHRLSVAEVLESLRAIGRR